MRGYFYNYRGIFNFIKDEKVKIQIFLSGLPLIYSDNMQYDEPKTLEEAIRRAKCLYDQHKGGSTFQRAWLDKKKGKMEQRRQGSSHLSSKIIFKDIRHKMNPRCQRLQGKDQDNNPLNVGDVREIKCTEIALIEEIGGKCTTFKRLIQWRT
jgi:hypothetical protein